MFGKSFCGYDFVESGRFLWLLFRVKASLPKVRARVSALRVYIYNSDLCKSFLYMCGVFQDLFCRNKRGQAQKPLGLYYQAELLLGTYKGAVGKNIVNAFNEAYGT